MTGRNNFPKKKGPVSHPSRLDQFGAEFAEDHEIARKKLEDCVQKPNENRK